MKKQTIVAAMLGLAMTGCANSRKSVVPEQPVGMSPIPSIHDTINRGASPAVAQTTLRDPSNPAWSGRAIPSDGPPRAAAPRVASTPPGAAGAAAVLTPNAPPAPFPKLAPEVAARQPSMPPQIADSDPQVSPSSISQPAAAQPAAQPMASQAPAPLPPGGVVDSPALPPVADDLGMPASPPVADDLVSPGSPVVSNPSMPDLSKPLEIEPYTDPLAPLPTNREASTPGPAPESAPAMPSPAPSAPSDPLLGPNPELMPSSLGAPAPPAPSATDSEGTAIAPTPAPAVEPSAPAPAVEPSAPAPDLSEPEPAVEPSAPAAPIETSSLPELSPSPVSGGGLASVPLREPAPTSTSAAAPAGPGPLAARSTNPRVDPEVRRTSTAGAEADRDEDVIDPHWQRAGETAARVGDEVITMRELTVGVKDQLKKHGVKASQVPRNELNMLAQNVLANLIDRSLIYQAARHELKDKKLTELFEISDKVWLEEELPPLLRLNFVTTEQQLKLKMEESGRSLAALKLSHRQDFIAMLYIQQKLKDKMSVELPEMLKYYNKHINDKTNYRAARITWREVVVETAKHPTPADAKLKADGLLARLQRGEDFAKLARSESEGPTAVRAQGGLMETSPGGYGVAAVNQAIEALPLGVVSGVIEGPSSLHIVRVERRRPAGPASFAELQDEIRREIFTEKSTRERRLLLDKLHANNVITTIFDGTESDPNTVKR